MKHLMLFTILMVSGIIIMNEANADTIYTDAEAPVISDNGGCVTRQVPVTLSNGMTTWRVVTICN